VSLAGTLTPGWTACGFWGVLTMNCLVRSRYGLGGWLSQTGSGSIWLAQS